MQMNIKNFSLKRSPHTKTQTTNYATMASKSNADNQHKRPNQPAIFVANANLIAGGGGGSS
jgi:hypothetical protein